VWGADTEGELGNNANHDKLQPGLNDVFFPAGTVLTSLAAGKGDDGGSHSLAQDRNGNLWGWGHNTFGQVGDGRGGADVFGPVQVCGEGQIAPCTQFLGSVIATAAGRFHSLALDSSGNVWAWGDNEFGQLGSNLSGNVRSSAVPVRNDALFAQVNQHGQPPIKAIASGNDHNLALDSGGGLWAWGLNHSGQLGLGSNGNSIIASPILSLREMGIKAIAAGGDQSFALDGENNVWAWGSNNRGQLGISSSVLNSNTPVKLDHFQLNTRITRIAAGLSHSLAIDSRDNLWAWGANDRGQLGIGETTRDSHAPLLTRLPAGIPRIIACGGNHSLAVDANGNLWAWGSNGRGQLGNGTVVDSHAPALVVYPLGETHQIVSIAAGNAHSLALESLSLL
jgi:alpha-tubulin suppressor-like RCC1 family protein